MEILRGTICHRGRMMSNKRLAEVQSEGKEPSGREDVAALRMMSRDERLALLMQSLDATCGLLAPRRRSMPDTPEGPRRKR